MESVVDNGHRRDETDSFHCANFESEEQNVREFDMLLDNESLVEPVGSGLGCVESEFGNTTCSLANSRTIANGTASNVTKIIATWALNEPNIPKASVSRLLKRLKCIRNELPTSFKNLLPSPNLSYNSMMQGLYVHFHNWLTSLKEVLCYFHGHLQGTIDYTLLINIDGLPLFHSPDFKLYPILITVYGIKMRPLCAGIYSTENATNVNMPDPSILLHEFFNDLVALKSSNIKCGDLEFRMANNGIYVCDAPARSSLKRIKSHTAYSSCEKCTVIGEYDSHSKHVCFLKRNCKLRTDQDFYLQVDKNHHTGTSVLTTFGTNMVDGFPVEYMHHSCLGVTKRMLSWWKGVKW